MDYLMDYSKRRKRGDAVLPTGSRVSPKNPYSNQFIRVWTSNMDIKKIIFYLVKFSDTYGPIKGYRLISSFGSLGFKVGEKRYYNHDQTMASLGSGKIVAILKVKDLTKLKKPVALWVYK